MNSSAPSKLSSQSGNVIPGQRIHVIKPAIAKSEGPHLAPACGTDGLKEPQIKVIKDGATVRAIEVTCTCGEVVRLDCVY